MDYVHVYFLFLFHTPEKVPILEKKKLPVVGIGKHLCGAATGMSYVQNVRTLNLTI